MAFPTNATLLDDFNRSDPAPIGGIWAGTIMNGTGANTLTCVGSTQLGDPINGASSGWVNTLYGPDCEFYYDVPVLPGVGQYIFLACNALQLGTASTWDGNAIIYIRGTGWQIRKYTNAVVTNFGTVNTEALVAGDKIGISHIDGVTSAWRYNAATGMWIEVTSHFDATYDVAGYHGVELGDTVVRLDNLKGGTATASITQQGAPVTITNSNSTTPLTIPAVPVNAGTDRCLVVAVHLENNGAGTGPTVTGITKNGVALTKLDAANNATWSRTELWYLLNPAVGTHDVIITLSAAGQGRQAGAIVFNGVHQTTPFGAVAKSTGTGTSASDTATVLTTDLVLDALTIDAASHAPVPGADQVEEWDLENTANDGNFSTQFGSAGGVMSQTWTTSAPYSHLAVGMKASRLAVVDQIRPDADLVTTGWATAPLFSKINDSSDATVVQGTAS